MKKHLVWILPVILVIVLTLGWFVYFRHLPFFQGKSSPPNNSSGQQEYTGILKEAQNLVSQMGDEGEKASFKIRDVVITYDDILYEEARLKPFDFEQTMSKIPEKDQKVYRSKLREDAVTNLLNRIYIDFYIEDNQITITEEMVEQAHNEVEKLLRERSKTPESFDLETYLTSIGDSMEAFRKDMVNQAKYTAVTAPLLKKVSIPSEKEIKTYYETNKEMFNEPAAADLDIILIDSDEKAEQVILLLKNRSTWENACAKFSKLEPEQTHLGMTYQTDMPEEMSKLVFASGTKLNTPYKVQFMTQWYVIKINSIKEKVVHTYEEARSSAEQQLTETKKRGIIDQFLKGLAEKYGKPEMIKP